MTGVDEERGDPDVRQGDVRSEVSGQTGDLVQARDVSGGVHFHTHEPGPRPVPRQLPGVVPDFTGRKADLAALDALLSSDDRESSDSGCIPGAVVISAIDGAAGIGKTTLAVYWAHRMRDKFPDGTLYANLRGYGPGPPAEAGEVLNGFLRALGVPPGRIPTEIEERAGLYRSILADRKVLVVLDNANSPAQVRPLLPASRDCLALVTSRSSLTGLVISQGAARLSLDLLPEPEAIGLLRGIVGAQRAVDEQDAVVGIVRACVRLPLALRIAGQRAASRPHLSLTEVLAELSDQRLRLDALSATGDEETAVRTVFAWSYAALPDEQALVFRRLGLHPGVEIDVHAAAALADLPPPRTHRALEALADVHLVEPSARGRYRTHDLLRAYALECAEQDDDDEHRDAAFDRLLGFYLHTSAAADRLVMKRWRFPPDAAPAPRYPVPLETARQAVEWFDTEYANLTAAARRAAKAGLHTFAWQLPAALFGLFDYSGHRADWESAARNALSAARAMGDRRCEQYALVELGDILTQLRLFEEAAGHAQRAVELARLDADRYGEGMALISLGIVHRGAGRLDEAAQCHEQAMEIFVDFDDRWATAIALNGLGILYQKEQRVDTAFQCHTQALDAFRHVSDPGREGWTLRLLGDARRAAGQADIAVDYHQEALELARQIGYRLNQAEALDSLAADLVQLGRTNSARDHWREAQALFEALGDPRSDDIRALLADV